MKAPKLLIIGGPSSGKSSFRIQFFHRLEREACALKLVKSLKDMASITVDSDRMSRGLQPLHTSHDAYNTASYEIIDETGRTMTLEFADYGGEQIRSIESETTLPDVWVKRAKEAKLWLFFLRIDRVRLDKSFITDPIDTGEPISHAFLEESHEQASKEVPDQYRGAELRLIETLQRLLFAHGASLHSKIASPRLAVLLSCCDEIAGDEQMMVPTDVLKRRAPLFFNFLTSNWKPEELSVFGLSSTEKPLPKDVPDRAFARRGLSKWGYVINEEGDRSPDLTLPVQWLWKSESL